LTKEETKWNFNEKIDRTGTKAIKWDKEFLEQFFGHGELLPLWVADMDFRAPEILIEKLKKRVEHGIFGYTWTGQSYKGAIINWFKKRHNWQVEEEWLSYSPGVVPALNMIIQTFSKPGDNVIIQEPVYYPFRSSIKNNGRFVLNNELQIKDNYYKIDFKDLKEKCQTPRTKMLILCSPHNPVGRVWTEEELQQLGEICLEENVLVVSDEIHCDLIMPEHKHIPFTTLSEEFKQQSIICTAPSKTFNIAGLKTSTIIIPNEQLQDNYKTHLSQLSIHGPPILGGLALETVYNHCEDWLDDMLEYIHENFLFLKETLLEKLPEARLLPLEGTYLAWVDFRKSNLTAEELNNVILEEAKVGLDDRALFNESGKGFQRINLACPRSILKEALERMIAVLKDHF
jgi:cystathionine beta-lyase